MRYLDGCEVTVSISKLIIPIFERINIQFLPPYACSPSQSGKCAVRWCCITQISSHLQSFALLFAQQHCVFTFWHCSVSTPRLHKLKIQKNKQGSKFTVFAWAVCHLVPIPGCILTLAKYLDAALRHRTPCDDLLCFSVTAAQIVFLKPDKKPKRIIKKMTSGAVFPAHVQDS